MIINELNKVYVETYGCQMNIYDSELALSILMKNGYQKCENVLDADVILVNTCSIRDNAEQRVWGRLDYFLQLKKRKKKLVVGVLGCMGERVKEKLFEHDAVNLVVGPDAYRRLPELISQVHVRKQIDIKLSKHETYEEIFPIKTDTSGITAFISIMRGCNKMCTYCIVPYVRGPERSRNPYAIVEEARGLFQQGYKEVNLLGQNVDSYFWQSPDNSTDTVSFAQLIEMVALIDPNLRVRFSTSHPKDMLNSVLYSMAMYPNICSHIHLPVQSGSDRMLSKMNRSYTLEKYLDRIEKIKEIIPEATITTDIIAGFCSESEDDHQATMKLMADVAYDSAFMFQYSTRPNTKADRLFEDDVPLETKTRRLNEIIALQNKLSLESNQRDVGKTFQVLIEGVSKRKKEEFFGRTSGNKVCIFPHEGHQIGDYVDVVVESCTSATLLAKIKH